MSRAQSRPSKRTSDDRGSFLLPSFLHLSCHSLDTHGNDLTPPTYVATTDADPPAARWSHELVDNTTKSASFLGAKEPKSLSRKHAWAAEMVYLQRQDLRSTSREGHTMECRTGQSGARNKYPCVVAHAHHREMANPLVNRKTFINSFQIHYEQLSD